MTHNAGRHRNDEPRRKKLRPGDFVKWTPSDAGAASTVPLEWGHPGRVSEPTGPWGVSVEWADHAGPLALEGEYDEDWLTIITEEEFNELSGTVREKRQRREDEGRAAGRTYLRRPVD